MSRVNDINIKNRTFYFFDDMININVFGMNNIKTNEKSYKNILIYHIGYVTPNTIKFLYLLPTTQTDILKKVIEINI